jgi:hypothetical protein
MVKNPGADLTTRVRRLSAAGTTDEKAAAAAAAAAACAVDPAKVEGADLAPHTPAEAAPLPADLQQARHHVAAFAAPDEAQSAWVVISTVALWVGTILLGKYMFAVVPLDSWWSIVAAAAWGVVRVGSYVRAFIVMHDALHGALFKRHWMNRLAALITGLLNLMDAEGGAGHSRAGTLFIFLFVKLQLIAAE